MTHTRVADLQHPGEAIGPHAGIVEYAATTVHYCLGPDHLAACSGRHIVQHQTHLRPGADQVCGDCLRGQHE